MLDGAVAEQPGHGRRDLVAQRVAQHSGVPRADADLGANQRLDIGRPPTIDQVPNVLLGAEADHDVKAVGGRDVEQRPGRHRMRDANSVEAVGRHQGEVPLDRCEVVILAAVGVRLERPVRHAPDVDLLVVDEEELAPGARPPDGGRGWRRRCRCRVASWRRFDDGPLVGLKSRRENVACEWHETPCVCRGQYGTASLATNWVKTGISGGDFWVLATARHGNVWKSLGRRRKTTAGQRPCRST